MQPTYIGMIVAHVTAELCTIATEESPFGAKLFSLQKNYHVINV